MPPPIWKKPIVESSGASFVYQSASIIMYSMPVRTVWTFFDVAGDDVAGEHIAHRRVFPAGHDHRQVFLHRGVHPRIFRVDLVILFERAVLAGPDT